MPRTIQILLADNDSDDREFFQAALAKVDFPTFLYQVQDGQELLDFLLRRSQYLESTHPLPDIVFLDLNMPRIDGLTVLERLRRIEDFRSLPVYILTTSYNLEDFRRCNLAGCHGFFTKPHLQSRLSLQITAALQSLRMDD